MLHTDQGWQYQMIGSQYRLWAADVVQSMSRKGNCLDNAMAESLIGMLKCECFCLEEFSGIPSLSLAIDAYIHYYNHERICLGQAVRENLDVSAGKKKPPLRWLLKVWPESVPGMIHRQKERAVFFGVVRCGSCSEHKCVMMA